MSDSPSVEELVEQYTDLCQKGNPPAPEKFAALHPEHAEELLELLPLVASLGDATRTVADAPDGGDASATIPELPGTDFRLVRKLGQGGMGMVFEAVQVSLDRRCAVKLLSPRLLQDEAQRRRFEQESRVIARLHHPNIVKVFSAGSTRDQCYYAMELIDGQGLDQCAVGDVGTIARIGLQAARALAYAHNCGIMHRDIKPANILLDQAGDVHISDFGLAFLLENDGGFVEEGRTRNGTIRYMSPERLSQGLNTFAADQYALGATLYELATQTPLLAARTQREMIRRICEGPSPRMQCRETDFAAIVNKSLSFRPEDRYASLDEMAEDLAHFLRHEPVRAAAPSLPRRLWLWARRAPLAAALALAVLATALSLVAALLVGYRNTRNALALARRNAAVADTTLRQVFTRLSEQPPSRKNADLLAALLPYYQNIARQQGLPADDLLQANRIVATCAIRIGDYPRAEETLRGILAVDDAPETRNQLARCLDRQGKTDEARKIWREVAAGNADAPDADRRFQAARAAIALNDDASRETAFAILSRLLVDHPDNADYRFEYATLLGRSPQLFRERPIPGIAPNAAALLLQLANAHPQQPEYGVALARLMLRRLRNARNFRQTDWDDLANAIELSEELLGRWPNDPLVLSAMLQLHLAHIKALRNRRRDPLARKEAERLLAILEILCHNPEADDDAREILLDLQFQQDDLADEARQRKIRTHLDRYHGPRKPEFLQKLANTQ